MDFSFSEDGSIVRRGSRRFDDHDQEPFQLRKRLHADARLLVKLERGAERLVEHPLRNVAAVPSLVTGHVTAKDRRS